MSRIPVVAECAESETRVVSSTASSSESYKTTIMVSGVMVV